jgi:glycosyltransferase involved in cell wall biosynthesis
MCDLLTYVLSDVIQWVGVGSVEGVFHDRFADEIRKHCPVYSGKDQVSALAAECDVVVSWFIKDLTPYPARRTGPVVSVSHSPQDCPFSRRFMACGFPGATDFVSVSQVSRNTYPAEIWDRIRVIKNAVDVERLKPSVPREEQRRIWGVPEGSKVVGFIARFSPEKGYQRVWDSLHHLGDEWVAVLVGDGIRWEDSKNLAASQVGNRAIFPGATNDVGSALNAFDCIVVPSDFESFCYVIAEAWAAGVPVISTPVGVVNDHTDLAHIIPHNSCGYEVANAIKQDEAHPDDVANRVRNARETVIGTYSMEKFGMEWTHYLTSLAIDWASKGKVPHAA